jgi:hypothetical protein
MGEGGERWRRRLKGVTTRATMTQGRRRQWHLRKKAEAAMAVTIIDCAALWQQSMVVAAMAVIIASSGNCCQWRHLWSLLTATATANAGKGRRGHEGEGVFVAQRRPLVTARARARAMAMARETGTARGTARAMARARARATASRKLRSRALLLLLLLLLLFRRHCFAALLPLAHPTSAADMCLQKQWQDGCGWHERGGAAEQQSSGFTQVYGTL